MALSAFRDPRQLAAWEVHGETLRTVPGRAVPQTPAVPRAAACLCPQDVIRGEVSWNTDTLGDFVLLRSNGLPVYNFCVAIDDALMKISHVIRAEEHLPNTLRQVGPAPAPSRRSRLRRWQPLAPWASPPAGVGARSSLTGHTHAAWRGAGAHLPGAGLPHPHLWARVAHPGPRQEQAV